MNSRNPLAGLEIKSAIEQQQALSWIWWKSRHSGDLALIAEMSGVSVQTVRRWNRNRAVPQTVAVLIEQIKNGPRVQLATFRGLSSRKA